MNTSTPNRPTAIHRALLVEDDAFMTEIVSDMLRDLGLSRVSTASGGDAAIKA
jgi:CheY-like chemotaxis protein